MDPFEVRMGFITLLTKLTSTVPSISKVASFALKHAQRSSDDLWDCYLDEVASANLNSRVNLLYLLDALLDKEGPRVVVKGTGGAGVVGAGSYRALVERDLAKVVKHVVPETREGVLNWMSTNQVLRSWKTRRLLEQDVLDSVIAELDERKAALHSQSSDSSSAFSNFSRNDILRRIEDDRERHKRLKERIWVLPVPSTLHPAISPASLLNPAAQQRPSPISPASPFDPSSRPSSSARRASSAAAAAVEKAATSTAGRGPELALEMEFEQLWEASEEERRAVQGPDADAMDGDVDSARPWMRVRRWELDELDREEMRSERYRCFEREADEGQTGAAEA
ncbi:hypothetical protein JCM10207_004974 [Rhodosporidiobolus poonsookiae]